MKQQSLQTVDTLPVASACSLVNAFLKSEDISLVFLPGKRLPVFSPYCYVCHKTWTSPMPLPSYVPGSRQRILDVTQGIGFLSHPSPLWHTAGCLLSCL